LNKAVFNGLNFCANFGNFAKLENVLAFTKPTKLFYYRERWFSKITKM